MKKTAVSLLLLTTLVGRAQTNAPADSGTNDVVFPQVIWQSPTPPSNHVLTLQDCLQAAIAHNFDVRIEQFEPQKAALDLQSAYASAYDPTFHFSIDRTYDNNTWVVPSNSPPYPLISKTHSVSSSVDGKLPGFGTGYSLFGGTDDGYAPGPEGASSQLGFKVTQPLLKNFWIDGQRLAISAAKNNLKLSKQGLRQQLITTVTEVETAYYELIFQRDNLRVQQEAVDLAKKQLEDDKQRVQVGSLAPLDVQQDEAQVAQSLSGWISAQSTFSGALRNLKQLISDDYSRWLADDIIPALTLDAPLRSFDLQESWNLGLSQRPDILQARLNLEQMGIQLKYDRNQIFPSLDLTGTIGYNGAGNSSSAALGPWGQSDRSYYSYGAELSIPLSNLGARSAYKSDKASQQQMVLSLKKLEQQIMTMIDNDIALARSAYANVTATKQARIYAEAALHSEEEKYKVGKSTTFTVLQLQNNLTKARSQELRALADYNVSLATLSQDEGISLERHQIEVSAK
ncbi:MAG TPA: TolC family protein [Verrucomicrobiae bacterium]